MKIRKTFVGNLPDNKIVNSNSTSETDTYSCKYLNERNVIVSSEEPTTGEEVWIQRGKNLLNPKTFLYGYDLSNGNVVTSSDWFVTSFIEVKENESYYSKGLKNGEGADIYYKCFYDENYDFIEVNRDNPAIIPSGTKYVRLCGHISNSTKPLFVQSNVDVDYEPYTPKKIHTKNDNGYEEFCNVEIIESGSNNNGNYTKFDDGTLICTKEIAGSMGGNAWGNVYYSDHSIGDWAYPFTTIYGASASISISQYWCNITGYKYDSVRVFRPNSGVDEGVIRIFAIGRWK